jgi:SulP family sulfate permease
MPAYRGLYAAALPPLAAAFFASSPYLQTGPVAITSLLTFGALSALAPPGSDEYVALGLLLALVVGAVRLLIGLARSGVVAYLMSHPVLLGFTSAAAILIVASQLPTAVDADPTGDGILREAAWTVLHPAEWRLESVALSLLVLALMFGGSYLHPLFPAVLVAVGLGIGYSLLFEFRGATVGSVPAGLPPVSSSFPWESLPHLLVPGAVIALVGFAEAASISRTFAALERRRWDPDREFVSQGVANLAAGLSGGYPVGGSFSRSAVNRLAGAHTRWSGAVTGAAVLAFLPFAGALASLPRAVLAAIVIGAVVGLIRVRPLLRLARYSRPQFGVASATFALTLALSPHVERAVIVGIALAIAAHLWRELSLEVSSWTEGDTLHLRPRGVLWFGSAARLEDVVLELLAKHPDAGRLAVHLDGLGRIDTTGALALRALLQEAREAGLEVEIVDVRPRWRALVARVIATEEDPLTGRS